MASALFTVLLPSTNNINSILTMYNAVAYSYGFSIGIYGWIIGLMLVNIYFIIQFRIFSGKMGDVPYSHH